MKKDYGPMPACNEEAARIAASIRDEDIDLSDIPEFGGTSPLSWKRGNERKHRFGKKDLLQAALEQI